LKAFWTFLTKNRKTYYIYGMFPRYSFVLFYSSFSRNPFFFSIRHFIRHYLFLFIRLPCKHLCLLSNYTFSSFHHPFRSQAISYLRPLLIVHNISNEPFHSYPVLWDIYVDPFPQNTRFGSVLKH
jgi:hypothetical protein